MERQGRKAVHLVTLLIALLLLGGCKSDGGQTGDTSDGSPACTPGTVTCNDAPQATVSP